MRLSPRRRKPTAPLAVVHVPASEWHTAMLVPYEGALIEFEARGVRGPLLRGRFAVATVAGVSRWWVNLARDRADVGPTSVEASRIVRWRYL